MDRCLECGEVVRMNDVTFAYNGIPVLEGVNLKVNCGDFLALIGRNGAAKSTLLKIMVGLLRPKSGEVRLFGRDIRNFRDWGLIGYISQNAGDINASFPATVAEVVASGYYGGLKGFLDRRARKNIIDEAMELVGIRDLAGRLIGELSGGQRQKVFLARALAKKPAALFLDEPTTGIDAAAREEFYRLLAHLNRERGMTIVIVTHDIGAAFTRAQKIGCVRDRHVYIHEQINEVDQNHIADVLGYRIGDDYVDL
ncbi:metal ABC transporter ATP-binding protein [Neomoorella humiferrea]|uniref:High-affinity zinc uptake system ATP-binding protein ZnuC n=1 Tax=Neomoorella humiferrea TaxID=676965 RepID=A0A2T0AK79_9FIRM|nr:metal ABC transporter ATP-binding protein [Moorella humiferrea]PRR68992.1 High-affinity zinc uptake system ATP-binding protein ZnuC [Moorella humiferrea]